MQGHAKSHHVESSSYGKKGVCGSRPYRKLKTPLTNHRIEPTLNAKEKFLDDLLSRRKKTTFKGYRRGLELFEEFYQKDFDTILKEAREKQQSEVQRKYSVVGIYCSPPPNTDQTTKKL